MPIAPIDITSLIAVFMGISIVLVPVIGITARFALKPTVEAFSQLFDKKGLDQTVAILERRMALMESQMESLEASTKRLADVGDFHMALSEGSAPPAEAADTAPGDEPARP
jgi:hypothetical protein